LNLFLLLLSVVPASSVCPHCKDSIEGCAGGDACPLVMDLASNRDLFETSSFDAPPVLSHLLSPRLLNVFTRSVAEMIQGVAATPAGGLAVDFSDARYEMPGAVVKAAYFGHCSAESAMMELMRRMDAPMRQVLSIASSMVGGENIYAAAPPAREPERGDVTRGDAASSDIPPSPRSPNPWRDSSDDEDDEGIPPTDRQTRGSRATARSGVSRGGTTAAPATPVRAVVVGVPARGVPSPPVTRQRGGAHASSSSA
jgi:hypothetical protein